MRVNVYAEEMTDRIQIIAKEIDGHTFTGLRFYLELPATVNGEQYQGPFMHKPEDDDSSAVTFWGKRDLRKVLKQALAMLDEHYEQASSQEVNDGG
jgi:3-deoxy-D-arabino-heptulosonate 7-phosphate (DAHP) synthase